jgi:hypothetical protein
MERASAGGAVAPPHERRLVAGGGWRWLVISKGEGGAASALAEGLP